MYFAELHFSKLYFDELNFVKLYFVAMNSAFHSAACTAHIAAQHCTPVAELYFAELVFAEI